MYSEFENNLNNLSEEAKAIIKKRKDQLIASDQRTVIGYHEANCPLAKALAEKKKLASNPLQNTTLTARQRRASFAGITSDIASKMGNNVTSITITDQKNSLENEHKSCPNCGDQIKSNSKAINEILEEEEGPEEDSVHCP